MKYSLTRVVDHPGAVVQAQGGEQCGQEDQRNAKSINPQVEAGVQRFNPGQVDRKTVLDTQAGIVGEEQIDAQAQRQ